MRLQSHYNSADWQALKQFFYQLLCNEDLDILEYFATYKCYLKTLGVYLKNKNNRFTRWMRGYYGFSAIVCSQRNN